MQTNRTSRRTGFTLVEILMTLAIFAILTLAILGIAQQISKVQSLSTHKSTAAAIASEQIEIVRNMAFDQVGTDLTFPVGVLPSSQYIVRNGTRYTVSFVIEYVDDPADGTAPTDTVPADYKLVEVHVCWDSSSCAKPVQLTTVSVPKTLEYAANAGALFVSVINANGQPVSNATVHVSSASPAVNVFSQTDVTGQVQLLNLPAASNSYHVVVTKSGYSTDQTVAPSGGNPNPTHPDTSVVTSQVTNLTLAIDHVSTLLVKTLDQTSCSGFGSVQVHIQGQRLIGTNPDVPAYDNTFTSDANGQFLVSNLPWDNYSLTVASSSLDVAGITPPDTIQVNAGSAITGTIVLAAHQSTTARIIVRDSGTHAPIANAQVTLSNSDDFSSTLTTDQGILEQTTWDGGAGQSTYGSMDKYAAASSAIDSSIPNVLTIGTTDSSGSAPEDFTTTIHQDSASTTADWSTSPAQLSLPADPILPGQYSSSAQGQSLTLNTNTGKISDVTLIASSQLNGQSVQYAVAADGATFETVTPGLPHVFSVTGSDLRWRVTLSTNDLAVTPHVTGLSLSYTQLLRPVVDGNLTSSTFDSGDSTNYNILSWEPLAPPPSAGSTAVRFQLASAGDTGGGSGPTVNVSSNPSTSPLFSKNMGDSTSTAYLAQSFTAGSSDTIDSIDVKMAQHNFPTTGVSLSIYNDTLGSPGTVLSGSGQDLTATVPDDGTAGWQNSWITQDFAPHTALVNGTKYWLVLKVSGANSSKYWTTVRSNTDTTYTGGTAKVGDTLGTLMPLCALGCDLAFQIRVSGQTPTPTTPTNFLGPDGTSATYYTVSGSTINSAISAHRYLRYKVFLHTDDPVVTPSINRISIIKNNACTPPGQAFFSPLPGTGDYTTSVTTAGYDNASIPITISGNVTEYIELTPNS